MRRSFLFRFLLAGWGMLVLGLLTAFTGWLHPGCLTVTGYFVPGLPCLPTPPPAGTPAPSSDASSAPGTGPVRLKVMNGSELPFSMTLTGPQMYVLNVASGETREFVVSRGTYSFEMMLCAVGAQGTMNLTKISTLRFKSCATEKLVEVKLENQTDEAVSVALAGPGSYVLVLAAGEARFLTITRGDYVVTVAACGTTATEAFVARSHRTLKVGCP
ncbi:MAG: hypothetical protein H6636_08120 [Anaerolineales bacterium]|nr:hypothetical protein [Anaerolineales bacterium]